jgi:hypothetical protein
LNPDEKGRVYWEYIYIDGAFDVRNSLYEFSEVSESYTMIVQVFKTNLLFNPTVSVPAPEGNKFLFANENKLVQNAWPPSVAKLLGTGSMTLKVGDEHKYINSYPPFIMTIVVKSCYHNVHLKKQVASI